MHEERELLERDLRGQTRVLKCLAQGASLDEVLHTLVEVAEQSRPDMIGSILLLDKSSGQLRHGASLRLPKFFCEGVDGVKPGPQMGSCGTAAYRGQRVVVENINDDPLWDVGRELALRASLQACWSEPTISSTGEVLGTFAMYYSEPRTPQTSELEFVASSANLAALAIERVRAQNEKERERAVLKTIVNGIPDALITGDLERKITHFSRSASRVFGYEAEEVLGQTSAFLYADPDDYDRLTVERFNPAAAERLDVTEVHWWRKSGDTFPGEMVGTTIRDELGQPLGFLGVIRDVTNRKLAEAKLAESQAKLVQAERLAAMGQMVSAIAHESRNALQRIQVSLDMLRYELPEGSQAREYLERIGRAKQDLLHLHDELRNFAGPIQLAVSMGNMAEVWRQAWTNLQVSRTGRQTQLCEQVNGVDLSCPLDAFRIEQVFRNLFENALAACHDPVQISLSCRDAQIGDQPAIEISVRDNGPGLQSQWKSRVFQAFHTTKPKGTGLGMAIAKRFIDAHGGSINVGDPTDGGAEFLITLPRNNA